MENKEEKKEIEITEAIQENIEKSLAMLYSEHVLSDKINLHISEYSRDLIEYRYEKDEENKLEHKKSLFHHLAYIEIFTKILLNKGEDNENLFDETLGKTYLDLANFIKEIIPDDENDAKD